MPTVQGSFKTGWLVLFTAEETKKIAKPVNDYGDPVAAFSALVPEPIFSKIISLGTVGLTFLAKKAAQEDRLLGVYVRGNPFDLLFRHPRSKGLFDMWRGLYINLFGFKLTGVAPFVYDEKDPESLESWRRSIGI